MIKIFLIYFLGLNIFTGIPLSKLKVKEVPESHNAYKLYDRRNPCEVYLDTKGCVKYRKYRIKKVKGEKLPFKLINKNKYGFHGNQINFKVDEDWIVGLDNGEFGGGLYWFKDDGKFCERIIQGNIKDILSVDGKIFIFEGLGHLTGRRGHIYQIERDQSKWIINKEIDLNADPNVVVVNENNEFIVVTSKGLIKVNQEFHIEQLIQEGFWDLLYPNSIVLKDEDIYIGMRGGILKTTTRNSKEQKWMTKKLLLTSAINHCLWRGNSEF